MNSFTLSELKRLGINALQTVVLNLSIANFAPYTLLRHSC